MCNKELPRSQHICGDSVFTIFSSHSSISVETVCKACNQEFYNKNLFIFLSYNLQLNIFAILFNLVSFYFYMYICKLSYLLKSKILKKAFPTGK